MEDVPIQYKEKIDSLIVGIGDLVNEMLPYIGELGDNFEMENDNFIVTIKGKGKHENQST